MDWEREKQIYFLLHDIRTINLDQLCFKSNQDKKDYFYDLPFNIENEIKPPKSSVGMSRGAKKKKEKVSG